MDSSTAPQSHVIIRTLLDVTPGDNVRDVAQLIADDLVCANQCTNRTGLVNDIMGRQEQSPTGMKGQIAIPHCRTSALSSPVISVLRLDEAVDFSGPDGNADIIFFIGIPEGADKAHMKLLSTLARAVVRTNLVEDIRKARDGAEAENLMRSALTTPKKQPRTPSTASTGAATTEGASTFSTSSSSASSSVVRVVAVTSCPTGVAHTYMAADALTKAADNNSAIKLTVETQGVANNTKLDDRDIAQADVAIIASAVTISGEHRLRDLPILRVDARRAVDDPEGVLAQAVQLKGSSPLLTRPSLSRLIPQALASGLSLMVPALMVAGILMFLAGLSNRDLWVEFNAMRTSAQQISQFQLVGEAVIGGQSVSNVAFTAGFLGFIAAPALLSMAVASTLASPRVGMGTVPGLVVGIAAVVLGTGFIGALIAGLLMGLMARALNSWKAPPAALSSATAVVLFPFATVVMIVALYFCSPALRGVYDLILSGLNGMPALLIVAISMVLGWAMNVDFGGPVNKLAYGIVVVGLTTVSTSAFTIMAAVMAAGMVAPIAFSVAAKIAPQKFSADVREVGRRAWISGLFFITEPAVKLVRDCPKAALPLRVGGALTAGLSTVLGSATVVPHGGVIAILGMPTITTLAGPAAWLGTLAIGVAVSTIGLLSVAKN